MKILSPSMVSGAVATAVLTAMHQLLKINMAAPPRMDRLGREALNKILPAKHAITMTKADKQKTTFVGEILANSTYYSSVAVFPDSPVVAGAGLGLLAGLGALYMPDKMGLSPQHSNATTQTKVATVALYLTAGIVAGLVFKKLHKKQKRVIK